MRAVMPRTNNATQSPYDEEKTEENVVSGRHTNWMNYKTAFLFQSKQEDFKILMTLFRLGRYFAATPLNYEYDERQKSKWRYCFVILYLIHLNRHISTLRPTTYILLDVVAFSYNIMNMIFLAYFAFCTNFIIAKRWISFYSYLNRMDQLLETLDFHTKQKKFGKWAEIFLALVAWSIWVILSIYKLMTNRVETGYWYTYGAQTIFNFYTVIDFVYVRLTSKILKARYDFINHILKSAESTNDNGTFFKKIQKFLKIGHKVILEGNIVLGWPFTLYVTLFINYILIYMNFVSQIGADWSGLTMNLCIISAYYICIHRMVMTIDGLGKSGTKITKTCFKLHLRSKDEEFKKKLMELAEFSKQMRPTLSAAGFFDIDQHVLNDILSTIINYSMTFLQFDMALDLHMT